MFPKSNQHKNNTCDDAKEIFRNSKVKKNMYHLDRKIFLLEIKATTQYSLTFIFTMEITSCPTKSLAIERKPLSQEF